MTMQLLAPNVSFSVNYPNNESAILLSVPKPSKDYSFYTLENIEFHSMWQSKPVSLTVNLSLFDDSLQVEQMKPIYKSGEMTVSDETHKAGLDGKGRILSINGMNQRLRCGQLYIFWIEVISVEFDCGFASDSKDEVDKSQWYEKYPLHRDVIIRAWTDPKKFQYAFPSWLKLFAFEIC